MFHKIFQKKKIDDEQSKILLYELFYTYVYKIAYFITRDPHIAQDVLQETFIKIFTNIHKVDDGTKIKAWITTIASRTAIDFIRKQKRRNEFDIENVNDIVVNLNEIAFTVEEEVERCLLCEEIREELNRLSPDHRIVLYLKYIHDLKDQEIASILEIKVATVKTRIHRAKNQLRRKLEMSSIMDGDFCAKN